MVAPKTELIVSKVVDQLQAAENSTVSNGDAVISAKPGGYL